MQMIYSARERYGPNDGDGWEQYVEWSKLSHLDEVVTLDDMLCPLVVTFNDDLWDVVVNDDYMLDFFVDLDALLSRVPEGEAVNILGVIRSPDRDVSDLTYSGFRFIGYDLMDKMVGNSALTNCGGFDDVFAGSELNSVGLLCSFDRAAEIQFELKRLHPEERHADCDVWAVFRMSEQSGLAARLLQANI